METLQSDIQPNMRAILMDWVVEVAAEYKLVSDTLFLAASYVDRFLSCRAIERTELQLVGVAALFLAAKYEEIYPPQLNDFVFVAASTYTREQVHHADIFSGLAHSWLLHSWAHSSTAALQACMFIF